MFKMCENNNTIKAYNYKRNVLCWKESLKLEGFQGRVATET